MRPEPRDGLLRSLAARNETARRNAGYREDRRQQDDIAHGVDY